MADAKIDDLLLSVKVLLACPLDAIGEDVASFVEPCWLENPEEGGEEP